MESIIDEQWLSWYLLSPMERWEAPDQLWREYVAMGGTLEPEVDTQSPFFDLYHAIDGIGPAPSKGPNAV